MIGITIRLIHAIQLAPSHSVRHHSQGMTTESEQRLGTTRSLAGHGDTDPPPVSSVVASGAPPGDTDPDDQSQAPGVQILCSEPVLSDSRTLPVTPGRAAPGPAGHNHGAPAFDAIYDAHLQGVWLALRRFGVWERELDDATHDVFLVVHRRLADFDDTRPVRPWLLGIAAHVASEFRRRARHRYEMVSDDVDHESKALPRTTPAHGMRADLVFDDKERRALVLEALEGLSFDRRVVLVLHDIEGHSMPEVAQALDVNVNTLYARLRAARADFARAARALLPEAHT